MFVILLTKERQIQPYGKENIEPDVLIEKITGYWGEMFEKNKTSSEMSRKQITSYIGIVYIPWSARVHS